MPLDNRNLSNTHVYSTFHEIQFAREGSVHQTVGPELALGVSWQNIKREMKCWLGNEHRTLWQGPNNTRRQAREFIMGPQSCYTKTIVL